MKFKQISGYDNYGIFEDGRILNIRSNKFLKQTINEFGYKKVNLWKSNKFKTCKVHRLVAINFLENKHNKRTVNHIDGNKLNNNLCNLEWATHSEQIIHSFKKLGRLAPWYNKKGASHHRSKPVGLLVNGAVTKVYESARIAAIENNICTTAVAKAARVGCKAGGMFWKYL